MSVSPHVYVHVPFCRRRCSYCDFSIAVRRTIPSQRFTAAVLRELETYANQPGNTRLETLYLGGGTPSLLPPESVATLIRQLLSRLDAETDDVEVTLEANPEDVTRSAARTWLEAGVTRVSLGLQSFSEDILRWMHRSHGVEANRRAVEILREVGIENVSGDLIFGLPDEVNQNLDRELQELLSLGLDHVSAYGLTMEPQTPFQRWFRRGITRPAEPDRYADEFLSVDEQLTGKGFAHYEVSNFALNGRYSRHNCAYWDGSSYLGLGPSAHSRQGDRRWWNRDAWAHYLEAVERGDSSPAGTETLGPEQLTLEAVYLGLRTDRGIAKSLLPPDAAPTLDRFVGQGWLHLTDAQVRPTPEGWLRLDDIVPALTTSAEGG